MGVSLSYWTTAAVAPELVAQIEREAARIANDRDWWCEPLRFFAWRGKPGLAGDTKIFFGGGYSTEDGDFVDVDPVDDMFLAERDARFIVAQLARWSATHGFVWELVCEEPIGRIVAGTPDHTIVEFFDALAAEGHSAGAADDERAGVLLARHVRRK
jgi:hypothetical protein